ncbi:MAG: aminotransferase class IV [Pelagibacteraceae bacterium]|nr:aminotransferase class IV [Pelagibacteraceae bacterium]
MANFLFRKSYRLSTLIKVDYDHLWGSKGTFTTIRVYGKKPKYIFIKEHLLQLNKSLKKLHINFFLTEKKLLELISNKLKIKKYNHLLRVAIKKNIISISLRPRLEPSNSFQCELINYQRINAGIKNLQYKKILSMQKKIDMQKKEILFYNKKNVLEGSTTNLILIKNNQIILPKGNYYKGITMNYLLKKIPNKHIFKVISFLDLSNADEIILVGSGKGVVKVTSVPKIKWFSSSSKMFKRFFSIYKAQLEL